MQCHWISFLPLSDLNFFYLLWCPFSSSSMPYFHFFFFPQVLHICCSHHLEYSFPPVFAWLPPSCPPCLSSNVPSKRDLLNPLRKVVLLPKTFSIHYTVTLCDTTYYNLNLFICLLIYCLGLSTVCSAPYGSAGLLNCCIFKPRRMSGIQQALRKSPSKWVNLIGEMKIKVRKAKGLCKLNLTVNVARCSVRGN